MALIKDVVQPFVTDLVHAVMPLTPSPLGGGFYNQVAAAFTTTITVGKASTYGSTQWGYSPRNLTFGSCDPTQVVFNGEDTPHPMVKYITSPYGAPVFYVRYDSGGGHPYDNTDAWPQDWIDGITMDGVVYSQSDANYGFFAGSTGSEVYHKWTSPSTAPFVDADIGDDFVITWNAGS
tara:strand:+ start:288 stop:821 length:534 start_codon:yes stop_codon:yes gene_type:complete